MKKKNSSNNDLKKILFQITYYFNELKPIYGEGFSEH